MLKTIIRKAMTIIKKIVYITKITLNPVIIEDEQNNIRVKGVTLRDARQKLANELVKKHNANRVVLHTPDGDIVSE